MPSLNIKRISKKLHEMYNGKIDLSDVKDNMSYFETRALAATALMIKCGLDELSAANNITDGYHDIGLDAIYLDETQKTLFLVQSKWRNSGEGSINQVEINTFVSGIKRVLDFDLDCANEKIHAKKEEIERSLDTIGYKIEVIFIHTGNSSVSDFVMKPMNDLLNSINDDAGTILYFSQIVFKDVYDFLSNVGNVENIKIDNVIMSNWGRIESPYLSYYGTISAIDIGEWFKAYGNKLFSENLRFYKGRTDVNEGIKKVLLQEPENFIYYNNGIKLLCKKINKKAKGGTTRATGLFSLEGVSLINGAQTTGSIGTIYLENPSKLENVNVMVQMIDMSNMSDDVGKLITKLSNTQNRIENKDFAAQDPVQEMLRRELSFSHVQYLYKTGDEVSDSSTQVSFDEAIVALACLWKDSAYATIAKGNVGALSEDISKNPYKALFNTNTNAFELFNSVLVLREVEKFLQDRKNLFHGKRYAAYVHGNRLIEHIILQKIRNEEVFSTSIMKVEKLSCTLEPEISKIINIIVEELENTYIDSYPANIFKNQSKSKNIAEVVKQKMKY